MNFKKSIGLIEILFVIVISSVLFISISNVNLDLHKLNSNEYNKNLSKIEFESFRLFLQKRISIDNNLEKLRYQDNIVFYNQNILIKNIVTYSKSVKSNNINIYMCIKNRIKMCQDIKVYKE